MRVAISLLVMSGTLAGAQTRLPASRDTLPPAARAAIEATDISWKSRRTTHAMVYALVGSAAEDGLATNAERAERAIVSNLAFLGVPASASPLRIFLVGSRDEMKRF